MSHGGDGGPKQLSFRIVGLVGTPFFRVIRPYIKIETRKSAQPGHRIELNTPPPDILKQALAHEQPCVACGAPVHPFRRRAPSKRGNFVGRLYYAPCCPLTVSIGCSRGNAAHEEYLRIVAAV